MSSLIVFYDLLYAGDTAGHGGEGPDDHEYSGLDDGEAARLDQRVPEGDQLDDGWDQKSEAGEANGADQRDYWAQVRQGGCYYH